MIPLQRMYKFLKIRYFVWPSLIVLVLAGIFTRGTGMNDEYRNILTVTSFLFGIMIAFSISDRYTRFQKMRDLSAQDAGGLTIMFEFSRVFGKKALKEMVDALDAYLIESFDYFIEDVTQYTSNSFYNILRVIEKMKIGKNDRVQSVAFDKILVEFANLTRLRKEYHSVASDRLRSFLWIALGLLAAIIIFFLFYGRTDTLLSNASAIILSSSVTLLLAMLYDLDNLSWSQEGWSWESYERVFDRMGRPRFYPEPAIKGRLIRPPSDKPYRLGIYKNRYPDNTKTVVIVKPKKK